MDPNEQMVPRMFSIPQLRTHISQKALDTPNFLYAALDTATCAPFVKERRMKFAESTKLHRKSGVWGTHLFLALSKIVGGMSIVFKIPKQGGARTAPLAP